MYLISGQERNSAPLSKKYRECQPRDPNSSRADDPLIAESCDKDQAYNNEHDNDTRGQVRLFHNEKQRNRSKSPDDDQCAGIVDLLLISLQKPGEENDQTDLNKFRRLEASDHRKCDPASRTRSGSSKLSCDNDRQQDRHTGKINHAGTAHQFVVIHQSQEDHDHQSAKKADQLAVDIASVSVYRTVDHKKPDHI